MCRLYFPIPLGYLPQGANRVIRGGNYFNNAVNCRPAYRNNWHPDNRNNNVGFRVVLSLQLTGMPDGFH